MLCEDMVYPFFPPSQDHISFVLCFCCYGVHVTTCFIGGYVMTYARSGWLEYLAWVVDPNCYLLLEKILIDDWNSKFDIYKNFGAAIRKTKVNIYVFVSTILNKLDVLLIWKGMYHNFKAFSFKLFSDLQIGIFPCLKSRNV